MAESLEGLVNRPIAEQPAPVQDGSMPGLEAPPPSLQQARAASAVFANIDKKEQPCLLGFGAVGMVGEVVAAGDDDLLIDDDDLVMRDGVSGIDQRVQSLLEENLQVAVALDFVALVEEDLDVDAALLGVDQGEAERIGGEGIGL